MSQHLNAIFENSVFRPEQPVNVHDGERVVLTIDSKAVSSDDLGDVFDSFADRISEERDER